MLKFMHKISKPIIIFSIKTSWCGNGPKRILVQGPFLEGTQKPQASKGDGSTSAIS